MSEIIMHSTGCPKCKILKRKLDDKQIAYTENNNIEAMLALGIKSAPVLQIDGELMTFGDAVKWVNNL